MTISKVYEKKRIRCSIYLNQRQDTGAYLRQYDTQRHVASSQPFHLLRNNHENLSGNGLWIRTHPLSCPTSFLNQGNYGAKNPPLIMAKVKTVEMQNARKSLAARIEKGPNSIGFESINMAWKTLPNHFNTQFQALFQAEYLVTSWGPASIFILKEGGK
jgi:hypothetical protein